MSKDRDTLKTVTKQLLYLFNRDKINYWIDFGTLLGAIREKDIISWDTDVDLSIMRSETLRVGEIISKIVPNHPLIHCASFFSDGGFKIQLNGTNLFIDIYPWEKLNETTVQYSPYPGQQVSEFGNPYFPIQEINEFFMIPFCGTLARVPQNYHNRLVRLYNNYMTPIKYR